MKLAVILIFYCALSAMAANPPDFMWGTATASYQVEGAYQEDGRGPSIWDQFSHTPGKTANGDTGDVADDQYHRYLDDIGLLNAIGVSYYRLSLSWSRILPTGEGKVNQAGIDHYNQLINALISKGIEPLVTLYHWDLPLALDTNYGGWLNYSISNNFANYADIAFSSFGDRVKYWLTFNEPLSFCQLGYGTGIHAPGRCSDRSQCAAGNSSTEPYICAHAVLLSHAAAVEVYRNKFQPHQKGVIGMTLNCDWAVPYTSSSDDQAAAERNLEFQLSWYADPIFFGNYPQSMISAVGSRLPKFTPQQSASLKGSYDFFGLNHYTTKYIANRPIPVPSGGWNDDQGTTVTPIGADGQPIGLQADSDWLYVVPYGMRYILGWVAKRYGNPPIIVTENGCDVPGESQLPLQQALNDTFRINYYSGYIDNMMLAMQDGVNVKGYFAWSLLDNFEWADGYNKRFGLHYVDYNNNLTRYQKQSALWFADRIKSTV